MIEVGSVYHVAVAIRDASGQPASPASAELTVTLPDLSTVSVPVSLPAVDGVVRADYVPTVAGLHRWRLMTSAPTTARSDAFVVVDDVLAGVRRIERRQGAPEHLGGRHHGR